MAGANTLEVQAEETRQTLLRLVETVADLTEVQEFEGRFGFDLSSGWHFAEDAGFDFLDEHKSELTRLLNGRRGQLFELLTDDFREPVGNKTAWVILAKYLGRLDHQLQEEERVRQQKP